MAEVLPAVEPDTPLVAASYLRTTRVCLCEREDEREREREREREIERGRERERERGRERRRERGIHNINKTRERDSFNVLS